MARNKKGKKGAGLDQGAFPPRPSLLIKHDDVEGSSPRLELEHEHDSNVAKRQYSIAEYNSLETRDMKSDLHHGRGLRTEWNGDFLVLT
ncbi:uncharacterized protein MEPE_04033 [Melanopsichium pennsylvanicum]|uniref:Uncharacterized protein n=1 Tax=Melanopsichium pennsylvanicum TaxID=63383 RepID=A0AAJ4XMZ7_9BASI|nr:uncharacterized protein MEPE_04033 [Melanopsichium pennsylvanicum]